MRPRYTDEDDDSPALDVPQLTDDEDVEAQSANLHVRSPSPSSDYDHPLPVPVWLRESARSFKFKWVPLSVRQASRAVVKWVKGPVPPKELAVEPFFPRIQGFPILLLDRFAPKRRHRICLLIGLYAAWLLTWSLLIHSKVQSGHIAGYGKPQSMWCGDHFWNPNNGCGLNGNDCRPFSSAHTPFRCGANCRRVQVLEERIVGNQSVKFENFVIGGPHADDPNGMPIYRGDSFICQAAIHAGVIDNAVGGCGVATLVGSHKNFEASIRNGISSYAFPATFPRSFTFQKLPEGSAQCPVDERWPAFAATAVALVILSLFTTSPAVFFFTTFVMLFFHTGLISDPPNKDNFYELISAIMAKFLPSAFISVIMYRYCAFPLLDGCMAQIEKTVLYLGFCFVGALNNYTFATFIPISRLTPHDLARHSAVVALIIIILIIVVIVIGQIYYIRLSGNMPRQLAIYTTMGMGLLILLAIPHLRLRIHHYILALIFFPGTGLPTKPGLAYQGLLLGLFINGVARWGFDSIVQTPDALGEHADPGGAGSWWGATSPNVTAVVAPDASNITFNWGKLPRSEGVDGVSILINDVERWRGYIDEELHWNQEKVTLNRRKGEEDEPEFIRFAWMNGPSTGLYGRPGTWDENGVWHKPAPGEV